MVAGKAQYTDGQNHTGQQDEPLRNHAYQGGDRTDDSPLQPLAGNENLFVKQQQSDGNNGNANIFDDAVDPGHDFRVWLFKIFSLVGNFRSVVFSADMLYPRQAGARNDKTA